MMKNVFLFTNLGYEDCIIYVKCQYWNVKLVIYRYSNNSDIY